MTGEIEHVSRVYSSGAYLSAPGESEVRWMGETRTSFLATGGATHGLFCLVDETGIRGEAVPLHRHTGDVESFYVLEGTMRFYLDGQAGIDAGSNSFIHVPAGTVHGFRITSETARYLILTTARHGEFYRAISIPAGPDGFPISYEVDWDKVMATAQEFGIELIGELPED